ncbi:hypothetical protein A0H81_05754 [Grifola frondosa]|uniref:Uncharacterized protein n=1 Tax=Grifola frondosa TaxID=5627 RepID=A0A1C7MEB1_GRIFR|nr:hypothetical protein A0H81_05754 [Grifola frondosa]
MLPLNASHSIPVVFYDQVSIGQSSHIAGKPKWFWTLDLFMDALYNLLSHFGFSLAIPREACLLDTTQGAAALPDCVTSLLRVQSFAACEADTTVYHTMFGHNEFICTGTRKTWYCICKLHNMSSTTLLFNASGKNQYAPLCYLGSGAVVARSTSPLLPSRACLVLTLPSARYPHAYAP